MGRRPKEGVRGEEGWRPNTYLRGGLSQEVPYMEVPSDERRPLLGRGMSVDDCPERLVASEMGKPLG